jgi:hypothetical protein
MTDAEILAHAFHEMYNQRSHLLNDPYRKMLWEVCPSDYKNLMIISAQTLIDGGVKLPKNLLITIGVT